MIALASGNASIAVSTARDREEATSSSMPSEGDPPAIASQAASACLLPNGVRSASRESSSFMISMKVACEQPAASAFSARGLCNACPWRSRNMRLLIVREAMDEMPTDAGHADAPPLGRARRSQKR